MHWFDFEVRLARQTGQVWLKLVAGALTPTLS